MMLPQLVGRSINTGNSVSRSHPLVTASMLRLFRIMPPFVSASTVRDALNNNGDLTLLSNCRTYGRESQIVGSSYRQTSGQNPRIGGAIWNEITNGLTIGMWVKFNAFPNIGAVVDTATRQTALYVGSGGGTANTCRVYYAGVGTGSITLSCTLYINTWYRIVYGVTTAGAVTVWVDGTSVGTGSVGAVSPSGTENIDLCNNTSGGGNQLNGFVADIFVWNAKLTDDLAALDFQEALHDYPNLMPRYSIWNEAPSPNPSATATLGDIGTITLTVPTLTAYAVTDATGTVGTVGTITLTVPTLTASGGSGATLGDIGTITLTVPTLAAYAFSNTAILGDIGTIYLYAPTVFPIGERPPNDYQQQFYWGRHSRGQHLNIILEPLYIPDDIPNVKFWLEGTSTIRTVGLPVTDVDDVIFGQSILLDADFIDGHYVAVIDFTVDHAHYAVINYFEVAGGDPKAPVTSMIEITRPLGYAVVSLSIDGIGTVGYNANIAEEQE
jgi:hypothetical protein